MKKTLLFMLWFLAFGFALILVINFANNEKLIKKYNEGVYEQNKYTWMGFTEPYIAHYNRAEIYYQKGEYELAIAEYEKSLEGPFIPKSRTCDARVNIVLCNLNITDFTYYEYSNDEINRLINDLRALEQPILEDGCANEDGESGHDAEAQQLYNDIEEYIDYLAYLKTSVYFCGYKQFVNSLGDKEEMESEQFSFLLTECDSSFKSKGGTPLMAFNTAEGYFEFSELIFNEIGTYYYTITEVPGLDESIQYDDTVYQLTITVEENADNGTLDVWFDYHADDPRLTEISFVNVKMVNPNGGGGDGEDNGGGGGSDDPSDDPSGGGGGSGDDPDPQPQQPEVDPLEQEFWDMINAGNEQHNNDLNNDGNHGGYYVGDFW